MSELNIPPAKTPLLVVVGLIGIAAGLWALVSWTLEDKFWGFIVTLVVTALSTRAWTQEVPEFNGMTILNKPAGTQRALFQGRTGKLPWEQAGTLVDLRSELKEILQETWSTKQGTSMDAKDVYILHPRATEKDVLAYASFTQDTVKTAARNLFTVMLSDHFGICEEPENLLKKTEVIKAVFESPDGEKRIKAFQDKYGVEAHASLEDVDYDEETQKARDIVSKATSIDDAINKLIASGMNRPDAEKIVRMLNVPGVQEFIISVDAKGLENLHDVTMLGGLGKVGKK